MNIYFQANLALAVANMMSNDQEGAVGCDPVIDLSRFKPEDFPTEDCDELARLERAREMREGVEPPPGKNCACTNIIFILTIFCQGFGRFSSLRRQFNQIGPAELLSLDGLAAALLHAHIGTPPTSEQPLMQVPHSLPEISVTDKVFGQLQIPRAVALTRLYFYFSGAYPSGLYSLPRA